MIRFFLLLLALIFPASALAVCTAGDIYTGTVSVPTGGSIINITLGGDPYTVVSASQVGGDATTDVYEGSWVCTSSPPVTCPDGSAAPGNDVAQCPPQDNFFVCADGSAAPDGDIFKCPAGTAPGSQSAQQLLEKTANATDTSNAFLNAILGAVSDLKNKASQALSAISDLQYNITSAISNQTAALSTSIGNISTTIHNELAGVKDGINVLVTKADHAIVELVNIQTTMTGIADNLTLQLANIENNVSSKVDQVRSAVSSGAAMVKSAVDESAINIVNAINAGQQAASTYYNDSLAALQNLTTAVATNTSAITQLPGEIANAIASNEALQGLVSLPSAISDAITGAVTSLTDFLDAGFDSINTNLMDMYASIDNLTDRASDFFAGTETPYSLQGAAELGAPSSNPLSTPEQVDVSGMINTNIASSGSCPAPASADVLGQTITFSYDPICDWANIVGKLILMIAAFVSLRILAGAH